METRVALQTLITGLLAAVGDARSWAAEARGVNFVLADDVDPGGALDLLAVLQGPTRVFLRAELALAAGAFARLPEDVLLNGLAVGVGGVRVRVDLLVLEFAGVVRLEFVG